MILVSIIILIIVILLFTRRSPKREFSCKFSRDRPYDDDRYVDIGAKVPEKFRDFYNNYSDVKEVIVGKDEKKFYVIDQSGFIHCITDNGDKFEYTPKTLKCKGVFANTFNKESIGAYMDSDGSVHLDMRNDKLKIGENADKIIKMLDAYKCNKDGIDEWFNKYTNYTISWIALNKGIVTIYYK